MPLVDGWAHTWSLAVEEHFYALLPLALLALGPARYRRLPWLFAACALACLSLRLLTAALAPSHRPWVHDWPTHLRIDSLLFGVVLAWAWTFSPAFVAAVSRRRWLLPLLALLCFLPPLVLDLDASPFLYTWGFSLLWLGSGCLVLWSRVCEGSPVLRSPPARWLAWVGASSYSVYLWHMPFGQRLAEALGRRLHLHPHATFALFVLASVLLGWLLTRLVERPALALRDWVALGKRHPALAHSASTSAGDDATARVTTHPGAACP
jgi:peptidoglycan/LPS O-acetylase OafA/YrhL